MTETLAGSSCEGALREAAKSNVILYHCLELHEQGLVSLSHALALACLSLVEHNANLRQQLWHMCEVGPVLITASVSS